MDKNNGAGTGTSLKALFQGMAPEGPELMIGKVIQASPLKIQMLNDEKLVINERITVVPWHLTDYTTKATFEVGTGGIASYTEGDGKHSHGSCGFGGGHSGDGTHTHHLVSFKVTSGTITVHNALKVGDQVHVLALNSGKLYYVLDKVAT